MDEVKRIRRERGLSQRRLAELAGVNKVTLVHIETGKSSPNVETLEKLADALEVEVADFFPKSQSALFPPDAEQRREELGHDWAGEVSRLQQRSEYRLQQRLDKATTQEDEQRRQDEQRSAALDFYEDWQGAYVIIKKAIDHGQATEVVELRSALHEWYERTAEFYAPARQRAQQDERLKDLDVRMPVEEERSARE